MNKLTDKVAIITGGASGIGKGIAHAFIKEGAKVAIVDLDEVAGQETVKELNEQTKQAIFIQANLAEHEKLPSVVDRVIDEYGQLDIVVNNAHASKNKLFHETTMEDLDLSFGTGFYPTFLLMQAALPHLKETKGKIINFASGAGINGNINHTAYAAAKEAIRAISRVAAKEFGPFGINVNLISPIANSPGIQDWAVEQPEHYQAMLDNIPMGRLGDLEKDIGAAAIFLASTDSDYITGQTIMVDGGATMLR